MAHTSHIPVISGDNLEITDANLDITAAAKQRTLVFGTVPLSGELFAPAASAPAIRRDDTAGADTR